MAWDVVLSRLGIHEEHAQLTCIHVGKVDDAGATLLAHAGPRPAHLPTAAACGNDNPSLWLTCNPREELQLLFPAPDLRRYCDEGRFFKDREYVGMYVRDVFRASWADESIGCGA